MSVRRQVGAAASINPKGKFRGWIPWGSGGTRVYVCFSLSWGSVSFVRGRRVQGFAMAEGTWAPTGACEPTLKLTAIEKGSLSLSLSLSLARSAPSTLSLARASPLPRPVLAPSRASLHRDSGANRPLFVAASRQLLDGCCWTAFSCQRFASSRDSSRSVQPSWKVSDEISFETCHFLKRKKERKKKERDITGFYFLQLIPFEWHV